MKISLQVSLIVTVLISSRLMGAVEFAYIHGDVAPDGTVPSGQVDPYHKMLLTDAGELGTSEFRKVVEAQGYAIEQFYDQEVTLDRVWLSQFDAIVFGLHQKIWSDDEKAALDQWLRGGGQILIYSDSASGGHYGNVGLKNPVGQSVVNNLIAPYGLQVAVDQGGGTRSYRLSGETDYSQFEGLVLEGEGVSPVAIERGAEVEVIYPFDAAHMVAGSEMTVDPRNISFEPERWAALAAAPVGEGRVFVLFDRQPMWNDGPGSSIQAKDNREVLSTLVGLLAE